MRSVLTKNDHAECDAIKKRSLMPIAPREGCGNPVFPPFFLFFPFFSGSGWRGCMRPAPTFVSHKQINFGRCFWWLICSKIGIFFVWDQSGEKKTLGRELLSYMRCRCDYIALVLCFTIAMYLNEKRIRKIQIINGLRAFMMKSEFKKS